MARALIVGSRASKLAVIQRLQVADILSQAHPQLDVQQLNVSTEGDRDRSSPLSKIGGKGVFIKDLEAALLNKQIDIAVHSFKDVTSRLAPGTRLGLFLPPEGICDCLVLRKGQKWSDLPHGARIGTGALRRKILLAKLRPDLKVEAVRGNVETRIAKVDEGQIDGILLSEGGLIRLGLADRISHRFDPHLFYPAPGQGVVVVQYRADDLQATNLIGSVTDSQWEHIGAALFALLSTIGFDCTVPLGAYPEVISEQKQQILLLRGWYQNPQTEKEKIDQVQGPITDAPQLGKTLARRLLT